MLPQIIICQNQKIRTEYIKQILLQNQLTFTHPDVLYFEEDKIGIEVAKKIKEHFSYKPNQAKGKAVVVENADEITVQSQNALLKTIEELPEFAIFLIGATTDNIFLPTVISRCKTVLLGSDQPEVSPKQFSEIETLLSASMTERFQFIEKTKDKEELLHLLLLVFESKINTDPADEIQKYAPFVEKLLLSEKWSKANVNTRGILEYLMLVMP